MEGYHRCAPDGHSPQEEMYCAKMCIGWYDRDGIRRVSLNVSVVVEQCLGLETDQFSDMSGCEVTAEHVPLARMPAVVAVSYNSLY